LEGLMINKDCGLKVNTLFEVLHGEETAAIYGIVNKGATYSKTPSMKEAWWANRGNWEQFDEKAADLVEELYDSKLLRFAFVWMPGIDHLAHFKGPTSPRVKEAMIGVDEHIGKIVNVLDRHGIYDKTLIGLISDHGLRDTEKNWNLSAYLTQFGLEVKGELSAEGEWMSIHRCNAAIAVSGNAFAHVYLCDDEGKLEKLISTHDWPWERTKPLRRPNFLQHGWKWQKPVNYERIRKFPVGDKRIDLVGELLAQESVKLLLIAEKWGKYRLFASSGQSVIERRFAGYRYSVEGEDPLGYTENHDTEALMADGEFHSGNDWLKASWTSAYPDALVAIPQLFDSHRCGDIVVLATPGCDLLDEGHIGSHGSLELEEMMTPAVLAGPGISKKELKYARTVDIFPTYLEFFGLNPAPLKIDGRTLDIFAVLSN